MFFCPVFTSSIISFISFQFITAINQIQLSKILQTFVHPTPTINTSQSSLVLATKNQKQASSFNHQSNLSLALRSTKAPTREAMAGNKQKKSGSSFSLFSMFKSKNSRNRRVEYDQDIVNACKVWPSDQDRGRWVADSGIDKKATAYIDTITRKYWNSDEVAN